MSAISKESAEEAKGEIKRAGARAKRAKRLFESIGDPDGVKIAEEIIKKAKDGEDYVNKRLG